MYFLNNHQLFTEPAMEKRVKEKVICGSCDKCEFWNDEEYKPDFRFCNLRIFNGERTMICKKDDFCKSFRKKEK